jgi:hypothetical protein
MDENTQENDGSKENDSSKERPSETTTTVSRRDTLKKGSVIVGAATVGAVGLWYTTQPAVAVSVGSQGAEDIRFGTTENVTSITAVTIQPEIDVAFSNFSSGISTMTLDITVQVDAAQSNDGVYEGTDQNWGPPVPSSDPITLSDTISADGSIRTFDVSPIGQFEVDTPDFTSQTSSTIGADPNFEFVGAVPVDVVLEDDPAINPAPGIEMFPQNIGPGSYGLSITNLNYTVTLTGPEGDSDSEVPISQTFDVAVENVPGTTGASQIDSNTAGSGEDGTN